MRALRDYTLSKTAREIIREQSIDSKRLEDTLFHPDSIDVSNKNSHLRLHKRAYFSKELGSKRILMVFVSEKNSELTVVFVMDTKSL